MWENDIFTGDYTSYKYGGFGALNEVHGSDVKIYVGELRVADGTSGSISAYRFLTHDHLGSRRGAYSDNTAPVQQAKFDYDPFGGADLSHRFTGHTLDPVSGFYGMPFRTYNSETGRWLQLGFRAST